MRAVFTVIALVLVAIAVVLNLTHHPIYGHCHMTADGYVCSLIKWEGNK